MMIIADIIVGIVISGRSLEATDVLSPDISIVVATYNTRFPTPRTMKYKMCY
jgi:hypothetical protein